MAKFRVEETTEPNSLFMRGVTGTNTATYRVETDPSFYAKVMPWITDKQAYGMTPLESNEIMEEVYHTLRDLSENGEISVSTISFNPVPDVSEIEVGDEVLVTTGLRHRQATIRDDSGKMTVYMEYDPEGRVRGVMNSANVEIKYKLFRPGYDDDENMKNDWEAINGALSGLESQL